MTLAEFLLARIAEDEAEIREYLEYDGWRISPERILAVYENKRRIVDEYNAVPEGMQQPYRAGLGRALRCLALPYAQHPDYRQEWRL